MKLIIAGTLPSMNEIVAESKRHYGNYSKMKAHYTNHVAWTAKAAKLPSIEGLANFEITWYVRNRKRTKIILWPVRNLYLMDLYQLDY